MKGSSGYVNPQTIVNLLHELHIKILKNLLLVCWNMFSKFVIFLYNILKFHMV